MLMVGRTNDHGIEIEDWQEFRASSRTYPAEFDNDELHSRQLLLAIAWLTDELLSKKWPAWTASGRGISHSSPETNQYTPLNRGSPKMPVLQLLF